MFLSIRRKIPSPNKITSQRSWRQNLAPGVSPGITRPPEAQAREAGDRPFRENSVARFAGLSSLMTDPRVPLVPMHRDSLHPGLNSVVGYADLVRDSLKRSCRVAMRSVPPALAGGIKRTSTEMRTCSTHPLTRMVLTPFLVRLLRQSPQAGSCEGVVKSCELIRGTVIGCECETGLDVFFLQIGEVCEDLFFTHSASKIFEYVRHGHARSANRRVPGSIVMILL